MTTAATRTLLVACGLKAEARIASGGGAITNLAVFAGGGDARRLEAVLDAAAPNARALLSFGIAGGLSPDLAPGSCLVARGVVAPDGDCQSTHGAWSIHLAQSLDVPLVLFAGVDAPLVDVAGKAALRKASGASVVDMESHIVGRVARRHGLPFAAMRVVADPADHPLPHAATVGMSSDGRVDVVAILKSLARDPRQIPGLIRTARDARAAFSALLRRRHLLSGDFGLVDLGDALLDMA